MEIILQEFLRTNLLLKLMKISVKASSPSIVTDSSHQRGELNLRRAKTTS